MARKSKTVVASVVAETEVVEVVAETEVVEVVAETEVVEVVAETEVVEVVTEAKPSDFLALLMTPVASDVVEAKPVVIKNQGVGKYVKELIADGLTNTAILAKVHAEYGNKNTTYACVAWYRNKMKKTNQLVSQAKAVEVVEKFMNAEEDTTVTDDGESELETADELRQMVGL